MTEVNELGERFLSDAEIEAILQMENETLAEPPSEFAMVQAPERSLLGRWLFAAMLVAFLISSWVKP